MPQMIVDILRIPNLYQNMHLKILGKSQGESEWLPLTVALMNLYYDIYRLYVNHIIVNFQIL